MRLQWSDCRSTVAAETPPRAAVVLTKELDGPQHCPGAGDRAPAHWDGAGARTGAARARSRADCARAALMGAPAAELGARSRGLGHSRRPAKPGSRGPPMTSGPAASTSTSWSTMPVGALGRFDRMDSGPTGDMLQVNIVALTELTRLLLPGMIAAGTAGSCWSRRSRGFSRDRVRRVFRNEGLCDEPRRSACLRSAHGVSARCSAPVPPRPILRGRRCDELSSMAARMRRMMRRGCCADRLSGPRPAAVSSRRHDEQGLARRAFGATASPLLTC